jgi:exonuclease III
MLPKSMDCELINTIRSPNGRYKATILNINKTQFCLINSYAPNTGKPKNQMDWLAEVQTILYIYEDTNIVVGGDLNYVFIPSLDRFRCKPQITETDYVKAWKTICDELNMVDIWRVLNPNKKSYT